MAGKDTTENVVQAEQGTLSPTANVEGKSTVDTKTGELVWQPQEVSCEQSQCVFLVVVPALGALRPVC